MKMAGSHWRKMTEDDLAQVYQIISVCHPDLWERESVIAERRRLSPGSCFVFEDGHRLAGYIIAHPWIRGDAPALDTLLEKLPANADVCYLHDIGLLPESRGSGNAMRGFTALSAWATGAGYHAMALIAIKSYRAFWSRRGFDTFQMTSALAAKLATYGDDVLYMVKDKL